VKLGGIYNNNINMKKTIILTESDLVYIIRKIINEQEYKNFPKAAFDFIKLLGAKGFSIYTDPELNAPTKAVKGDIKVHLIKMDCNDPNKFGLNIITPNSRYEGCVGNKEMSVTTTKKGKKSKGYQGTLSNDWGYEPESPKTKMFNKDIGVEIDKIIRFAESGN